MSVEFEEDSFSYNKPTASPGKPTSGGGSTEGTHYRPAEPSRVPKMSQWMIQHGLIRSETAAQIVLVTIIIITIILTYIVVTKYVL